MKRARWPLAVGLLLLGCESNRPPVILKIRPRPEVILPGDTVELRAEAADPERGRLTYKWQANGGALGIGQDSLIEWYAPDRPGRYKVWLQVADALGARARKSVGLKVVGAEGRVPGYRPPKGERVSEPARRPGGRQTDPDTGTHR